ncbi:MAG TPA: hypothetical protein VG963_27735, partial [Polyangiaceae bacterium]|nr:hypothetical protein [Polyangiaceae bacterium]
MTSRIPFAGLAPDSRLKRGSGELAEFGLAAALEVSRSLRKASWADASSTQVLATLLDGINAFEHDGRPACVLLRAFVTCRLGELGPELQSQVRAGSPSLTPASDPLCLRLAATRGIEPAWNDVKRSVAHGALLVESNAAPLLSELVRQLRVAGPTVPSASSFYVPEAANSSSVPSQSFVRAYGIRSVFGFGAKLWPGEIVVVIGFSRAFLERSTARAFETVALYTKAAWLNTREARAALLDRNYEQHRANALAELVTLHEGHLHTAMADFTLRLEATRSEAMRTADLGARKIESQNSQLRRTQRAMLNVIDDLREARGALESQVASRTRELGIANKQLEARNRELEEFVYIASHDLQEP